MTALHPDPASGVGRALSAQRLPRWNDLPDLDIYMDQVLSLISRYLADLPGMEEKGLTSSMVNNYVKLGIMPSPVNKRYNRTHLAYLVIICILKSTLPIGSIGRLIESEIQNGLPYEELYNRFCDYYENTIRAVLETAEAHGESETHTSAAIFYAALRSQAEQALALKLLGGLPPPDAPKDGEKRRLFKESK